MENKLKGLLLVLDGLVLPLFEELVKQGKMPNFSEHLIGRKMLNVRSAFSCHPSSTYENMQAINTGQFPLDPGATYFSSSTSNIVDLLRVDNTSKGFCAKKRTIFHHVSNSVSIHNPWNDGADDKHPNIYSLSIVKKAALAMIKKACVILDGDPKREILVEIRKETINQKANEIKKKELQRLAEEFSRLLLQQKD